MREKLNIETKYKENILQKSLKLGSFVKYSLYVQS